MSYIGSKVHRVYGYDSNADVRAAAGQSPATQMQGETLTVSATANARKFKGPTRNGHYSAFVRVTATQGATSAMTVWYSNLPEPDVTDDTHWVQDTGISSVDLTATGNTFLNIGNVNAEWIRFKPVVATSAGAILVWVRVEGIDHV